MPAPGVKKKEERTLYCSFCRKSQHEVKKLVAGPAVFICDECTALCGRIIASTPDLDPARPPKIKLLDSLPTPRLLALLKPQELTCEDTRAQLQFSIDVLRTRKVSWAAIAKSLGISRQAAWERFA